MQKITFGLIGISRFGKHYARLLQEIEGVELRMVASRSYDTLNRVSSLLPSSIKKTTNAREIMENPSIECVIIATPAPSHFLLAKDALTQGKHVLIEKPMVTNIEDAYALKKIVGKSGRVFMVGHQYIYNDFVRYLKGEIGNGRLKNVRYFFAEQMSFGPLPRGVGCVWERATHELSIIDYLFRPGNIKSVEGIAQKIMDNEYEDCASFQIVFENGLFAAIAVSWLSPGKTRRIVMSDKNCLVVFDDEKQTNKLCMYTQQRVVTPAVKAREPLKNELEHFIDCVQTQSRPLTDITHGIRVTEYLDCVSRNIRKA